MHNNPLFSRHSDQREESVIDTRILLTDPFCLYSYVVPLRIGTVVGIQAVALLALFAKQTEEINILSLTK